MLIVVTLFVPLVFVAVTALLRVIWSVPWVVALIV